MKVLKALTLSIVFLSLFVWIGQARAITTVSGTITENATWTVAGSPYVLAGEVRVVAGVTLTVVPGVVMKLDRQASLRVEGTLVAEGTASQPIVWTSLKDDSIGGDTNNDGTASSPAAGDWYTLWLTDTSRNNRLAHVVLRYGGGGEP